MPKKMQKTAEENFKSWNDSLLTRDPEKPAGLYSDDATFLPTLSSDFKKGKKGARDYFEHFLKKHPNGKITDEAIHAISESCYLHCGMYSFAVGPESARKEVRCRFTYAWQKKENGSWEILHHHSSLLPAD